MQLQYMKPIPAGTCPKVLLLGNGIHRTFHSEDFAGLLRNIGEKQFTDEEWKSLCDSVPFPLLAVIASGDTLGSKMPDKGRQMAAQEIPQAEIDLLRTIREKSVDAILTTDYTYEIEHALIPGFICRSGARCKYRYSTCEKKPAKETLALYTYIGTEEHSVPPVWHIHGEAAKPDSMILGHYYYGNLMGHIRTYVAETVRRYKISEKNGSDFYPRSWVDYFLFGDVTIIGQGMNFCEIDLWWLINCKKRNGCGNITHYEPVCTKEKKLLAEAYGVNVVTDEIGPGGFEEYYRSIFADKL